jgi:hypothetical protein
MGSGRSVTHWLIGWSLAAGAAGAALAIAGIDTPLRLPLVLLFLAAVPALAVSTLLGGLDPLAKVVIAGASAIVVNFGVAEGMIMAGAWSLAAGVAGVALFSALIVAARLVTTRMSPARIPNHYSELADHIVANHGYGPWRRVLPHERPLRTLTDRRSPW